MTSTGGQANWWCAARALDLIGCRCLRMWVGRSPPNLQRSRSRSKRREVFLRLGSLRADRAGHRLLDGAPGVPTGGVVEVGAHRLRHTVACEMVSAASPWCRSRRCCGITACRARRFTPAWTSTSCGCWLCRGRKARSDERAERTRGGPPAVAPGAGGQAGARRATAPTAGGLPRGGRGSDDHQRARDRVGAPAGAINPALGAATRHRPRICAVRTDDGPRDRGATAWCVPVAPPPPGPLPGVCQR